MGPRFDKTYDDVTGRLPQRVAGWVDLLRPSYRAPYGGPLNGQERRAELLRALARSIRFDRVLETGTYRGTSTALLRRVFRAPVASVDSNPRFAGYSSGRFVLRRGVTVDRGDSRAFLAGAAAGSGAADEAVFVYLDAHWQADLPLWTELAIVQSGWSRAVVLVDDFEVPGDAGYGWDDYGPGQQLSERNLPEETLAGWSLFYPSAPSELETGYRRGCCVLASPALAARAAVAELRFARVLGRTPSP
jgi:predicted O-methyltransferase YrrM